MVAYTSTEVQAHWVECKNPAMCNLPYRTRDGVRRHRVFAHTLLTPIKQSERVSKRLRAFNSKLEAGSPAPKLPEEFHGIKERPRSILSIFPALVYFPNVLQATYNVFFILWIYLLNLTYGYIVQQGNTLSSSNTCVDFQPQAVFTGLSTIVHRQLVTHYFLMDFGNLQKTIYIVPIHIGHSARSNPLNIKSPLISNVEFIKLYILSITLPPLRKQFLLISLQQLQGPWGHPRPCR